VVEIAIAKLKKYKSPGSDEILAELIQVGGETLLPGIHKLINPTWNKEVGYHYQLHTKFHVISFTEG
jgi:hypothetical protein